MKKIAALHSNVNICSFSLAWYHTKMFSHSLTLLRSVKSTDLTRYYVDKSQVCVWPEKEIQAEDETVFYRFDRRLVVTSGNFWTHNFIS